MTSPNKNDSIPPSADLFPNPADFVDVKELRKLSEYLHSAARNIDEIIAMRTKKPKDRDVNGEPTFAFSKKVPLPTDFYATLVLRQYARHRGLDADKLLEEFKTYYGKHGTKWMNWSLVWMQWCRNELERRAAAPRKEASTRDLPEFR